MTQTQRAQESDGKLRIGLRIGRGSVSLNVVVVRGRMSAMPDHPPEVTVWLSAAAAGDKEALARVFERLYTELKLLAQKHLAHERVPRAATTLVNDVFLKMVRPNNGRVDFANRRVFFAAAAECMRQILVDDARKRNAEKRGGGKAAVPLDDTAAAAGSEAAPTDAVDVLDLHEALPELQEIDPEAGEIVKLRYFVGMSEEATAETLGLARRTVQQKWRAARAWLRARLGGDAR